jgi:hypothetical protein
MKVWLSILLIFTLIFLGSVSCLAAFGGDNFIWVSEDLKGEYSKIGYFRQDQMFTKISATSSTGNNYFDLSLGNKIMSFENYGGLYGELGVNSGNGKLDLFFGAGYIYQSSDSKIIFLAGPKYYVFNRKFVAEANAYLKIMGPVILHAGYDSNSNNIFIGIGVKYK